MNLQYTTPEQADKHWREMGEPPGSRKYLRTIYFDGEAVVVPAPSRNYPNTETGD